MEKRPSHDGLFFIPNHGVRVIDFGGCFLYSRGDSRLNQDKIGMNFPCILIVHHDSLWSRVLERPGIWPGRQATVVVCEATTVQDLLREINFYSADVVLMSESIVLARKENLAELLMVYPKLRVIVASGDSNWVHVFHKEDILISHLNDLFSVIDVAD